MPMRRALLAGLAYFAVVFAVGFALGTVRVLWLAPRLGERIAEIAEMPFMIAASWFAARAIVGRMKPPMRTVERATVGGLALAVLLAVEFGVVRTLRGLTLDEALGGRDPVAFAAYLAALAAFAAFPLLAHRAR
jgi:hypothetical protein